MSLVLILAFVALMVAVIPVAHALVIASGVALLWDGNLPTLLICLSPFALVSPYAAAHPLRLASSRTAAAMRNHVRGENRA